MWPSTTTTTTRLLQEDEADSLYYEYGSSSSGNQFLKTFMVMVLFVSICLVARTIYKNLKETGTIIARAESTPGANLNNKEAEMV